MASYTMLHLWPLTVISRIIDPATSGYRIYYILYIYHLRGLISQLYLLRSITVVSIQWGPNYGFLTKLRIGSWVGWASQGAKIAKVGPSMQALIPGSDLDTIATHWHA